MPLNELTIGEEVKVYEKGTRGLGTDKKLGYCLKCAGMIAAMTPEYILVDNGKYKGRYDVVDFWIRKYRIFKSCGTEVRIPSLPDKAAIEEELRKKIHEEYMNGAGKSDKLSKERTKAGTSISWAKVNGLLQEGKTQDEIVTILNTTDWIVKGLITKHKKLDEKENSEMIKAKITRQQLYAEVKERGTGKDSLNAIAGKYGMKASTIGFYLTEWEITKQLREEGIVNVHTARTRMKKEEAKQETILDSTDSKTPKSENDIADFENENAKIDNELTENATSDPMNNMEQAFMEAGREIAANLAEIEEQESLQKEGAALKAIHEEKPSLKMMPKRIILQPLIMRGALTGREYMFSKDGLETTGFLQWDELPEMIEELQAILEQRSA